MQEDVRGVGVVVPKVIDRVCTVGDSYCVGAVADFDPEAMRLEVGPGIFKISEEFGRYEFPGCEVELPAETTGVYMLRERATGRAVVGVNVGYGLDDITYEVIEAVLHLEAEGWCVVTWVVEPGQWADGLVPDPALVVKGPPAEVVVFDEMPAHLKRALEIRNKGAEAAQLHRVMRGKSWSDSGRERIIEGILDRLDALDGEVGLYE